MQLQKLEATIQTLKSVITKNKSASESPLRMECAAVKHPHQMPWKKKKIQFVRPNEETVAMKT